jgi:hypothetical protein
MDIEMAVQMGLIANDTEAEIVGSIPKKPSVTASDFLSDALSALKGRAELRDKVGGERSAGKAASILSAWTGDIWTEGDVWKCLIAVKLAREEQGKFHADDLVDLAGYAALLAEYRNKTEV